LGFLRERTRADLAHVAKHCLDPAALPGNIERFIGVADPDRRRRPAP
jgi:hypothetical protein